MLLLCTSPVYQQFNCANTATFSKASYDARDSGTTYRYDNWRYIGVLRPDLFDAGRKLNSSQMAVRAYDSVNQTLISWWLCTARTPFPIESCILYIIIYAKVDQGQVRPKSFPPCPLRHRSASIRSVPVRTLLSRRSAPRRSATKFLPPTTPCCYWYRRASGNTPPEKVQGTSSSREIIVLHEILSNSSP